MEILTFSLLSDQWVLLGVKNEADTPCLVVVDFVQGTQESPRDLDITQTKVVLKYPTLPGSPSFFNMNIRADPGPLWKSKSLHHPFSNDTQSFIFVVSVQSFLHSIPSSYLCALVESAQLEQISTYEFDAWINRKTRLFIPLKPPSETWVCYIYGNKFLFPKCPSPQNETRFLLHLLDFNQLGRPVGGVAEKSEPPGLKQKQKPLKKLLKNASLSYQSYGQYVDNAHKHCEVMISEDNIILIDVSA